MSGARAGALARITPIAAVIAALLGAPAAADTTDAEARLGRVEDGDHGYAITIPTGWAPLDGAAGKALLAYRSGDGHVLAVTRLEAGNRALGRGAALADALERGAAAATEGYRRVRRAHRPAGPYDVVDLEYVRRHAGGLDQVAVRFVVMRTRTLALTIAGPSSPKTAARAAVRALRDSFGPFPPPTGR